VSDRPPALRASGLSKAFGRRAPVFAGVDLELAGPALVRVEGANGAGKSTLLRLLAGVTRPTRGDVTWAGAGRAFVPERFRATGALRAGELLAAAGAGAGSAALDSGAGDELEQLLEDRARTALVVVADHEVRLEPGVRVRVAGGGAVTIAPAGGEARVRIRTGPSASAPLAGATADGGGWLAEVPRAQAQAALAELLAAGVEVREVRPL